MTKRQKRQFFLSYTVVRRTLNPPLVEHTENDAASYGEENLNLSEDILCYLSIFYSSISIYRYFFFSLDQDLDMEKYKSLISTINKTNGKKNFHHFYNFSFDIFLVCPDKLRALNLSFCPLGELTIGNTCLNGCTRM